MAVSAGTAFLDVAPRLSRGFSKDFQRQVAPPIQQAAEKSGRESGRRFGARFSSGISTAIGPVRGLVRGVGGAMLAAFGGIAVVAGIKSTIDAASDLQEVISKTRVVFGRSAREIERWSKDSARAFGLSRTEALNAASSFGDMFLQLKIGQDEATRMSTKMVELSADFASFHNADITEVLQAQASAFRGEFDALQRFIPNINAARVEEEALALAHKKSAKELTAAEKAQAVYNIMLKDGKRAQGDFARTSEGAANQQRILRARIENTKAAIGARLLPAYSSLLGFLNDKLLPVLGTLGDTLKKTVGPAVQGLADEVQSRFDELKPDLTKFAKNLVEETRKLAQPILDGFGTALSTADTGPLGRSLGAAVGAAIGAGISGVADLSRQVGGAFLDMLGRLDWLQVGKDAAHIAVPFVIGFVNELVSALVDFAIAHPMDLLLFIVALFPIGRLGGVISKVLAKIPFLRVFAPLFSGLEKLTKPITNAVLALVRALGRGFVQGLVRVFPGLEKLLSGRLGRLPQLIRAAAVFVRDQAVRLVRGLGNAIISGFEFVGRTIGRLVALLLKPFVGAGGWLLRRGRDLVLGLVRGVNQRIGRVRDVLVGIAGRVRRWVGDLGGVLLRAGRAIIAGLIAGILSQFDRLRETLGNVGDFIARHKGPLERDRRLLQPAGRAIIQGLRGGIDEELPGLRRQLRAITAEVPGLTVGGLAGGGTDDLVRALLALARRPTVLTIDGEKVAELVVDPRLADLASAIQAGSGSRR